MTQIQTELFNLQDEKYRAFHGKLIPTVSFEKIIGVRTPNLRKYAKNLFKAPERKQEIKEFLETLPHEYYEENNLNGDLLP